MLQTKLKNFIQREDLRCVHSSEFLEDFFRSIDFFEVVPLTKHKRCKFPPGAHLAAIAFKVVKGIKSYRALVRILKKDEDLCLRLGYNKGVYPDHTSLFYFRRKVLTKKGEEQFINLVKSFLHNNSFFITDNNDNLRIKCERPKNPLKLLSTKQKKRLVSDMKDFICSLKENSRISSNIVFSDQDIINSLSFMCLNSLTTHAFSNDQRFLYEANEKGGKPCYKTLLNWIKNTFKTREEVQEFNQFFLRKIFNYIKINKPELFNRNNQVIVALDHHLIPTWENIKIKSDSKRTLTNPNDIISCAKDRHKSTINFRKFLCLSIVVKGVKFCLGYKAIDMFNNSPVSKQVDELLNFAKEHVIIKKVLLDRNFDNIKVHKLLQRRGLNYVMPKIINSKELKEMQEEAEQSERDIILHRYKMGSKKTFAKMNIIFKRNKGKNDDDYVVHAFCTNMKIISHEAAKQIVESYRARWCIETFFKDNSKLIPKTSSNDSIIRDFCFSHSINMFNLWTLCNFILYATYLLKEPDKPLIRMRTFITQLSGVIYENPPTT